MSVERAPSPWMNDRDADRRRRSHDLTQEPVRRGDAALALAASDHAATPDIPRIEVRQGALTLVLVFDALTAPAAGGAPGWMRLRAWIEGFASALMTTSPGSSDLPSKRPAYKSSTGPAFCRKSCSTGSVGG